MIVLKHIFDSPKVMFLRYIPVKFLKLDRSDKHLMCPNFLFLTEKWRTCILLKSSFESFNYEACSLLSIHMVSFYFIILQHFLGIFIGFNLSRSFQGLIGKLFIRWYSLKKFSMFHFRSSLFICLSLSSGTR